MNNTTKMRFRMFSSQGARCISPSSATPRPSTPRLGGIETIESGRYIDTLGRARTAILFSVGLKIFSNVEICLFRVCVFVFFYFAEQQIAKHSLNEIYTHHREHAEHITESVV